jgi:hypothetical protein
VHAYDPLNQQLRAVVFTGRELLGGTAIGPSNLVVPEGSLPHLSRIWAFREKVVSLPTLRPTDETLYEDPSCDGISWILRFALNSLREDRERGTKLWPEKKAQYQKMTPSEKAE